MQPEIRTKKQQDTKLDPHQHKTKRKQVKSSWTDISK